MDHPRRDFLAGASRSRDQHARSRGRHPLDLVAHRLHHLALAAQLRFGPRAQAKLRILPRKLRRFQRPPDNQQQPVRLKRLLDEVVGPMLQGRDGGLDIAMPGYHHRRHHRLLALDRLQDPKPVQPRSLQPHIQDHQRRPARPEGGNRRIRIRGQSRLVSFVAQQPFDQKPDIGLVIDDQDFMRHCRRLPGCPRGRVQAGSRSQLLLYRRADRPTRPIPRGPP